MSLPPVNSGSGICLTQGGPGNTGGVYTPVVYLVNFTAIFALDRMVFYRLQKVEIAC
jgi:hypothetical protein